MAGFRDNSNARETIETRLATPARAGHRSGMSATDLIGSRLSRVYEVVTDVPRDMDAMLRNLGDKGSEIR